MQIDMMLDEFDSRNKVKFKLSEKQRIVLKVLQKIGTSSKQEIVNYCEQLSSNEVSNSLNTLKEIEFVKSVSELDPRNVDMRLVKYENNVEKKNIYVPLL